MIGIADLETCRDAVFTDSIKKTKSGRNPPKLIL